MPYSGLSGILPGLVLSVCLAVGQPIQNYKNFTAWGLCKKSAEKVIILRHFEKAGHTCYFTVSPETMVTAVVSADSVVAFPVSWNYIQAKFSASPYILALKGAEKYSLPFQNAGITRFKPTQQGIDLTVDLCPSRHPLDRIVFTGIIRELGKVEEPVPVAVSITGKWILKHPKDLFWLDSLRKAGRLKIVWINHTFNHQLSKNAPLIRNFMLKPGVDVNAEVLNTEVSLIEKNLLPSVFFRFPGLVSDKAIFGKILSFGLIPVGSDAWLSKGQVPQKGSIVLIHANGNDPAGVHDFIELLKQEREAVLLKRWELFDLRESMVKDVTE